MPNPYPAPVFYPHSSPHQMQTQPVPDYHPPGYPSSSNSSEPMEKVTKMIADFKDQVDHRFFTYDQKQAQVDNKMNGLLNAQKGKRGRPKNSNTTQQNVEETKIDPRNVEFP